MAPLPSERGLCSSAFAPCFGRAKAVDGLRTIVSHGVARISPGEKLVPADAQSAFGSSPGVTRRSRPAVTATAALLPAVARGAAVEALSPPGGEAWTRFGRFRAGGALVSKGAP